MNGVRRENEKENEKRREGKREREREREGERERERGRNARTRKCVFFVNLDSPFTLNVSHGIPYRSRRAEKNAARRRRSVIFDNRLSRRVPRVQFHHLYE
jgi:hypothetical protein